MTVYALNIKIETDPVWTFTEQPTFSPSSGLLKNMIVIFAVGVWLTIVLQVPMIYVILWC